MATKKGQKDNQRFTKHTNKTKDRIPLQNSISFCLCSF